MGSKSEERSNGSWYRFSGHRGLIPGRLRWHAFAGGLLAGLGVRAETMKKESNTTSSTRDKLT